MSIELFVRVLLRNWWMVVLTTIITAGSGAVYVFRQQPVYRATTVVELRPSVTLDNPNDILNTINALTRRQVINTLARRATSGVMHKEIAEALEVPVAVVQASNLVAVAPIDTNLLEIRAESTDPQFAATVANTVAERLLGQTLEKVIQMEVMDVALPPTQPFEPQPQRVITLATAFGMLLGLVFALLEHFVRQARETGSWLPTEESEGTTRPSLSVVRTKNHRRAPVVNSPAEGEQSKA